MDRRIGVTLPVDGRIPAAALLEVARAAEAAGLDTVSVGEVAGTDAFALAAALGAATSTIRIDVCAAAVTTRSSPLLAMAAATVAGVAPDRFVLTLGSGSESVAAWHGAVFVHPKQAVTTRVEELRLALRGERLADWGGFRLSGAPAPPVPLYLAALNPTMVELAGRLCDGLVLTYVDPGVARDLAARARAMWSATSRPGCFEVVATAFVSAGDDPEADAEAFKLGVAAYTAVGTYRHVLTRLAGEEAIDAAAVVCRREGRRAASRLVPDQLVRKLLVSGGAEAIAARLAEFWAAGVDTVRFIPVAAAGGARDALLRVVERLGGAREAAAVPGGWARSRRDTLHQAG